MQQKDALPSGNASSAEMVDSQERLGHIDRTSPGLATVVISYPVGRSPDQVGVPFLMLMRENSAAAWKVKRYRVRKVGPEAKGPRNRQ